MTFNTILFDADGVLFDAADLHKQALIKALETFNITITSEYHDKELNGLPTRVKLAKLEATNPEAIEALKQDLTYALIKEHIKPSPELQILLLTLKSRSFKLAICSNARTASVLKMAEAAEIKDCFDLILGNESITLTKPAPDIWLKAASELGSDIRSCIIVEDSVPGLQSAVAAKPGMILPVFNPLDMLVQLKKL